MVGNPYGNHCNILFSVEEYKMKNHNETNIEKKEMGNGFTRETLRDMLINKSDTLEQIRELKHSLIQIDMDVIEVLMRNNMLDYLTINYTKLNRDL